MRVGGLSNSNLNKMSHGVMSSQNIGKFSKHPTTPSSAFFASTAFSRSTFKDRSAVPTMGMQDEFS